jgi:hypothetical protein
MQLISERVASPFWAALPPSNALRNIALNMSDVEVSLLLDLLTHFTTTTAKEQSAHYNDLKAVLEAKLLTGIFPEHVQIGIMDQVVQSEYEIAFSRKPMIRSQYHLHAMRGHGLPRHLTAQSLQCIPQGSYCAGFRHHRMPTISQKCFGHH